MLKHEFSLRILEYNCQKCIWIHDTNVSINKYIGIQDIWKLEVYLKAENRKGKKSHVKCRKDLLTYFFVRTRPYHFLMYFLKRSILSLSYSIGGHAI